MESIETSITAPEPQQGHPTEAEIFQICAKAGVCYIGIQRGLGVAPDFVLFQPTVTTLAVPLAAFEDPDEAIAAIKANLAQSSLRR